MTPGQSINLNEYVNWLIEWKDPVRVERLLAIDGADQAYLIDVNISNGRAYPYSRPARDIELDIMCGEAAISDTDPYAPVPLTAPKAPKAVSSKKAWWNYRKAKDRYDKRAAERDRAYAAIEEDVTTRPFELLNSKTRRPIVTGIMARAGIRRPTALRYLRWYWQRGQTRDALQSEYHKCRVTGETRDVERKTGRPHAIARGLRNSPNAAQEAVSRDENLLGVNMAPFRAAFVRGLHKYYLGEHLSLPAAYKRTILEEPEFKTTLELPDGTTRSVRIAEDRIPTLDQFEYLAKVERAKNPEAWEKKRHGRHFDLTKRSTTGRAADKAFGPGSLYILDSSVADIFLRHSIFRGQSIGRPILYLVVDAFSGLIVGFSILLRGPSYVGAMLAMENAATNKVAYCARYNIDLAALGVEWPGGDAQSGILPAHVWADNAELLGNDALNLVTKLGITRGTTPPWRPDLKGLGERRFRSMNDVGLRWEPGAAPPKRERGDHNCELDGVYTLEEFRRQLILLIQKYNYRSIKNYPRTKYQIEDAVEPRPIALWNWGIRRRGHPHRKAQDMIRLQLLPRVRATVTRSGLMTHKPDLLYDCTYAAEQGWYVEATDGEWEVTLARDPRNTTHAWLVVPADDGRGTERMEPCSLTPKSAGYADYDVEEVEDAQVRDHTAVIFTRSDDLRRELALDEELAEGRALAQTATVAATRDLSAAEQLRNRKAYRADERAQDEAGESWRPSAMEFSGPASDHPGTGESRAVEQDNTRFQRPDRSELLRQLWADESRTSGKDNSDA